MGQSKGNKCNRFPEIIAKGDCAGVVTFAERDSTMSFREANARKKCLTAASREAYKRLGELRNRLLAQAPFKRRMRATLGAVSME